MLLSSLNTGSTDLRDTEVQQPNTTATLSLVMSSRAFSANSGQFEAGSTTTASSFLPRSPPFLFCSSTSMSMTSFSVVSLMAIVPESECRTPTLMVSCADTEERPPATPATAASALTALFMVFVFLNIRLSDLVISAAMQRPRGRKRYAKKFCVGRFTRRTGMCLLLKQMPDRCAGGATCYRLFLRDRTNQTQAAIRRTAMRSTGAAAAIDSGNLLRESIRRPHRS